MAASRAGARRPNGGRRGAQPETILGGTVLTVSEAAPVLGLTRAQLYAAIERGEVCGVVRIGRCIRLRRDAVLQAPRVAALPAPDG